MIATARAPATPDNVMPDNVMPDNVMPDNVMPDNVMPDNVMPDNAMPTDAQPGRERPLDLDILPGLLGYQLRRAQILVYAGFSDRLARHGLTHGQFGLLIVVGANPGSSQTALANVFGSNRSVIVRMIDKLEGAGLLGRKAQEGDRRSNAIVLTEAGEALLATLRDAVRAHEERIAGHLSADERGTLMGLLARLNRPG